MASWLYSMTKLAPDDAIVVLRDRLDPERDAAAPSWPPVDPLPDSFPFALEPDAMATRTTNRPRAMSEQTHSIDLEYALAVLPTAEELIRGALDRQGRELQAGGRWPTGTSASHVATP